MYISDLTARVDELETENSKNYDEIKTLESNFGLAKAESRQYQAELTVINQVNKYLYNLIAIIIIVKKMFLAIFPNTAWI